MKEAELDLNDLETVGEPYEPPELAINIERDRPNVLPVVVASIGDREVYRDRLDVQSMRKRERAAKSIAEKADLNQDDVEAALIKASKLTKHAAPEAEGRASEDGRESLLKEKDDHVEQLLDETPGDIREEALSTLRGKSLDRFAATMTRLGLTGEKLLCQLLWVVCCSSKLDRPLAQLIEGASSSGKSYLIDCVSRLVPPESLIEATDLTPSALYYFKPGELIHAVIISGESTHGDDPDRREARKAFREMLSAGKLSKAMPVRTSQGGFETSVIRQPGPISYAESTTSLRHLDENANRMLRSSTDDSPEQTKAVIMESASHHEKQGWDDGIELEVEVFRTMFRLMKRVEVYIPFAEPLSAFVVERFGHLTEARRAHSHLMNTIKAVTLIRQYRRIDAPEHGIAIDANLADYRAARRLLARPLALMFGVTGSAPAFRFGRRMFEKHGKADFTAKSCDDLEVRHKSKRTEYLGLLADYGYAEMVQAAAGPHPAVWRMLKPVPSSAELTVELPDPKELK